MSRGTNYWERVLRYQASRRRTLAMGAAAAGAAAISFACGSSSDSSSNDNGGSSDGQPKSGGTLSVPAIPFVAVLDPHQASQPNVLAIWHNVSHKLVEVDEDLRITDEGAAQSWEQADDVTLIFKLHDGITFQDVDPANGRAFTADDVVYSLERIKTPEARFARRTQFEQIERIEAVDDKTVRLTLKEPYAPILMYLGSMYNMLVCPEAVEKYGSLERPESNVGIGPFILKEYNKESHATLVKNPNYWREGLPYLDGIEITVFADAAPRHAALRAGQLHFSTEEIRYVQDVLRGNPNLTQTETYLGGLIYEFGMNQKTFEPFADLRVRKAIHLVIDRDEMVAAKWGARENGLLAAPVPPPLQPYGLTEEELYEIPGYRKPKDEDIAEAKKLMEAAGYPDGFKVEAKTADQYLPDIEPLIPVLREHLKIDIDLNVLEWGAFKQAEATGETLAFGTGYLVEPEPDATLRLLHHSAGSRNYVGFADPEADRMIEAQAREYDEEARAQLTKEAARYLIDQVAHAWHGGAVTNYRVIQPNVHGVVTPTANFYDRQDYTRVWIG